LHPRPAASILNQSNAPEAKTMKTHAAAIVAFFAILWPAFAVAEADGPDVYRVIDVSADEVLNLRTGPGTDHPVIGALPHDADGVANLGCVGGMTFAEFETASAEERAAARKTRWCLVGFDRQVGWAAGWFLAEGGAEDRFDAGGSLGQLAGSEWQLTRLGDATVAQEATLAFGGDGTMGGLAGCNRMRGSYTQEGEALSLGPLATTMMLCPEAVMQLESGVTEALEASTRAVAHHLVLALLDEDNRLRATFRRLDFD
jgi:heat shock protein HslJ